MPWPGRSRAGGPASSASSRGSLEDLGEQRFVEALGRGLGRHDLHMLVADARGEPERELALARRLGDQWVDGLIVSALDPSAALWEQLGEALPVVAVGDALGGRTVGQVLFDNRAGVTMMLEDFHALGHRRLAVLTPSRPTTPDRPAEIVVAEVCETLGLEATIVNSPHSVDGATEVAASLLAARPRPTAVFCLSDSIACGVYAAAADRGLAIPRDLSVAGYDDHPIARVVRPALTSVDWGPEDVASAAADLLAAAVAGRRRARGRARVRVTPTLVSRALVCGAARHPPPPAAVRGDIARAMLPSAALAERSVAVRQRVPASLAVSCPAAKRSR